MVTTSEGVTGLIRGEQLPWLEEDEADVFAAKVCFLLNNKSERARLSQLATRYAEGNYSWTRTTEKLIAAYHQVLVSAD